MNDYVQLPPNCPPYLDLKGWADLTKQTEEAVKKQVDRGDLVTFKLNEAATKGKRFVNVVAEFKRMSVMSESIQ